MNMLTSPRREVFDPQKFDDEWRVSMYLYGSVFISNYPYLHVVDLSNLTIHEGPCPAEEKPKLLIDGWIGKLHE